MGVGDGSYGMDRRGRGAIPFTYPGPRCLARGIRKLSVDGQQRSCEQEHGREGVDHRRDGKGERREGVRGVASTKGPRSRGEEINEGINGGRKRRIWGRVGITANHLGRLDDSSVPAFSGLSLVVLFLRAIVNRPMSADVSSATTAAMQCCRAGHPGCRVNTNTRRQLRKTRARLLALSSPQTRKTSDASCRTLPLYNNRPTRSYLYTQQITLGTTPLLSLPQYLLPSRQSRGEYDPGSLARRLAALDARAPDKQPHRRRHDHHAAEHSPDDRRNLPRIVAAALAGGLGSQVLRLRGGEAGDDGGLFGRRGGKRGHRRRLAGADLCLVCGERAWRSVTSLDIQRGGRGGHAPPYWNERTGSQIPLSCVFRKDHPIVSCPVENAMRLTVTSMNAHSCTRVPFGMVFENLGHGQQAATRPSSAAARQN